MRREGPPWRSERAIAGLVRPFFPSASQGVDGLLTVYAVWFLPRAWR
jgi:hypothetical protein